MFATKQRLVWQKGLRVKVWHLGGVIEGEGSGSRFARSKVGPIPREPLSSFLLPLLSVREELRSLFQSRAKLPTVCRAVAGLEGTSQQALQRSCAVRRAFASSLAAVKRKAPCSQIKLQMVSGSPVPMEP